MRNSLIFFVMMVAFAACSEGIKDGRETKALSEDSRKPANEIEANIYRSADSMMAAFRSKDWATFAKYNHPTMLQMKGGEEAFVSLLAMQMQQVPDSLIKNIEIGKILQVVKTSDDHQCVVEQNTIMEMEGTRISSTTYLLGESLNGGKNWTFFDATNSGAVKATDIKRNISNELKIPEKKQEVKPIE